MTRNYRYAYDPKADAMYIHLGAVAPAAQKEYAEDIILDLDADGGVIGIELLSPGSADLGAVVREFNLDPHLLEVFAKLQQLIPEAREELVLS